MARATTRRPRRATGRWPAGPTRARCAPPVVRRAGPGAAGRRRPRRSRSAWPRRPTARALAPGQPERSAAASESTMGGRLSPSSLDQRDERVGEPLALAVRRPRRRRPSTPATWLPAVPARPPAATRHGSPARPDRSHPGTWCGCPALVAAAPGGPATSRRRLHRSGRASRSGPARSRTAHPHRQPRRAAATADPDAPSAGAWRSGCVARRSMPRARRGPRAPRRRSAPAGDGAHRPPPVTTIRRIHHQPTRFSVRPAATHDAPTEVDR